MLQEITIIINRYAQEAISFEDLMSFFEQLHNSEKHIFYCELYEFIIQSKCSTFDIDTAIKNANIKPTLNCCVIARKGIFYGNIKRTEKLKDVHPTLKFLLNLFKIGYQRRRMELNSSQKRWYNSL